MALVDLPLIRADRQPEQAKIYRILNAISIDDITMLYLKGDD